MTVARGRQPHRGRAPRQERRLDLLDARKPNSLSGSCARIIPFPYAVPCRCRRDSFDASTSGLRPAGKIRSSPSALHRRRVIPSSPRDRSAILVCETSNRTLRTSHFHRCLSRLVGRVGPAAIPDETPRDLCSHRHRSARKPELDGPRTPSEMRSRAPFT